MVQDKDTDMHSRQRKTEVSISRTMNTVVIDWWITLYSTHEFRSLNCVTMPRRHKFNFWSKLGLQRPRTVRWREVMWAVSSSSSHKARRCLLGGRVLSPMHSLIQLPSRRRVRRCFDKIELMSRTWRWLDVRGTDEYLGIASCCRTHSPPYSHLIDQYHSSLLTAHSILLLRTR